MKHSNLFLIFLIILKSPAFAYAYNDTTFIETEIILQTKTGKIFGTLTTPLGLSNVPVALIISGSGPSDRNGSTPYTKNEVLKKLAYGLAERKIASLRFDKRGVGKSESAIISEENLSFDDYVNDVIDWVELLKKNYQFTKIIIIGHSEGSLIGMIASNSADKFISISGAGTSADNILKEQLGSQAVQIQELSFSIIDSLKEGHFVNEVPYILMPLFRPSVQPYLISWFKYDPKNEIRKLKIPILIIQGTNDLQVSVEQANLLLSGNPKAKLVLIDSMNHIFRKVGGPIEENMATYNNPFLPIAEELIEDIVNFIKLD